MVSYSLIRDSSGAGVGISTILEDAQVESVSLVFVNFVCTEDMTRL